MYDILDLSSQKVAHLREIAKKKNIKTPDSFKQQYLVYKILDEQAINPIKIKSSESVNSTKEPVAQPVSRPRGRQTHKNVHKENKSVTKEKSDQKDKPKEVVKI